VPRVFSDSPNWFALPHAESLTWMIWEATTERGEKLLVGCG